MGFLLVLIELRFRSNFIIIAEILEITEVEAN